MAMIVAVLLCHLAKANESACSDEQAKAAEANAANLVSWKDLYLNFKSYANCDDGGIAEGFSESVSIILSEHWKDLKELSRLAASDQAFRHFVISHIDQTVPAERLALIAKNASRRCPSREERLCKEIYEAAIAP